MAKTKPGGRRLRALWGTLTVLCLLGAGAMFGMVRFHESELEFDATASARDLAQDRVEPILHPSLVAAPLEGERYDKLLGSVEERVLQAPTSQVRIWTLDGTAVFADDPTEVGASDVDLPVDLSRGMAGVSRSEVTDGQFRTFTWTRVEGQEDLVVIEIVRPYAGIVAEAKRLWEPWVPRALTGAAVFGALYLVTVIGFGAASKVRRRRGAVEDEEATPERRSNWTPGMPEYMRPGYRQEVEERRRREQELIDLRVAADRMPAAPPPSDPHEDLATRLRRRAQQREEAENRVTSNA